MGRIAGVILECICLNYSMMLHSLKCSIIVSYIFDEKNLITPVQLNDQIQMVTVMNNIPFYL